MRSLTIMPWTTQRRPRVTLEPWYGNRSGTLFSSRYLSVATTGRAAPPRQRAPGQRAEDEEGPGDGGRRRTGCPCGRLEEREPEGDVLGDIAVLEREDLAPQAARHELRLRPHAIEPLGRARVVVVRRQLVVGCRVAPAPARREALSVHGVDEPAHARRRAGGVDVEAPALDRSRVEEHERRMDHRPRVGEGDVEGVHARADGREELGEPRHDARAPRRREHADGQVGGAHGRLHDGRRCLAREVRERPGLGERQRQRATGARDRPRHRVAAERSRREQDDLSVVEARGQALGEVLVARRGQRRDQDLRALDRLAEVRRGALEARRSVPPFRLERDRRVVGERAERVGGATPEPHAVTGQREIRRRRASAVARAQARGLHATTPGARTAAVLAVEYLSNSPRTASVCSPSFGGGGTSRPIAPSTLTGVPSAGSFPWTGWAISTTIPRRLTWGSARTRSTERIGAQGTPSACRRASQSSVVRRPKAASIRGASTSRFATRSRLVLKRRSCSHSGCSTTRQNPDQNFSAKTATIRWPSRAASAW